MKKIFISYRRGHGDFLAGRIYDYFISKNIPAFYDVESLNQGRFNEQILHKITGCDVFLPVLSPGSLDRCVNDGDWVRFEIAKALAHKKTIIPIMMPGFSFPDNLPSDIRDIENYQGITIDNSMFKEQMRKLLAMINYNPVPVSAPVKRKSDNRLKIIIIAAICLILTAMLSLAIIVFSYVNTRDNSYPESASTVQQQNPNNIPQTKSPQVKTPVVHPNIPEPTKNNIEDYVVICDTYINLYEDTSTSSAILEKIYSNQKVKVIQKNADGFYKVIFKNKTGYVFPEFLHKASDVLSQSDSGSVSKTQTPETQTTYLVEEFIGLIGSDFTTVRNLYPEIHEDGASGNLFLYKLDNPGVRFEFDNDEQKCKNVQPALNFVLPEIKQNINQYISLQQFESLPNCTVKNTEHGPDDNYYIYFSTGTHDYVITAADENYNIKVWDSWCTYQQ